MCPFQLPAVRASTAPDDSRHTARRRTMSRVPKLLIFDLDACLWSPEMFELRAAPTTYDAAAGGVRAGSEVVRLFPGALAVLRRLITDPALNSIKVAVASSTTEPAWANRCLDVLMVNAAENSTVGALVDFRQICALPGTSERATWQSCRVSPHRTTDLLILCSCRAFAQTLGTRAGPTSLPSRGRAASHTRR